MTKGPNSSIMPKVVRFPGSHGYAERRIRMHAGRAGAPPSAGCSMVDVGDAFLPLVQPAVGPSNT